MSALATAKLWFAHHRTQALVGGGVGVAGVALYKRRHGTAGAAATPTGLADTGAASGVGYGDPGAANSSLSDVDAALLDADLTGIQGTLDGIRKTLGKLPRPGKSKAGGKAGKKPAKKAAARKPKRGGGKARTTPRKVAKQTPAHKKPPRTRADQKRRYDHASRTTVHKLPAKAASPAAVRRPVNNPPGIHLTGRPIFAAPPVPAPAAPRRQVAAPSPKPISHKKSTLPAKKRSRG